MRDEIVEANDYEGATIPVNLSEFFNIRVERYEIMKKEINDSTVDLQSRMLTLA